MVLVAEARRSGAFHRLGGRSHDRARDHGEDAGRPRHRPRRGDCALEGQRQASAARYGKAINTTLEMRTNQDGEANVPSIPQGEILIQINAKGYQTYGKVFDVEEARRPSTSCSIRRSSSIRRISPRRRHSGSRRWRETLRRRTNSPAVSNPSNPAHKISEPGSGASTGSVT